MFSRLFGRSGSPPPTSVGITPDHLLINSGVIRNSRGRSVYPRGFGNHLAEHVIKLAESIIKIYNNIKPVIENNVELRRDYLSHIEETYAGLDEDIEGSVQLDRAMNVLANHPPKRKTNADTIRYWQNVWNIEEQRLTIYTKLEQEERIMKGLFNKLFPPIVGGKYRRGRKTKRRYTMRR